MQKSEVKVGMRVVFGRDRGQQSTGTVTKVNRTRAKVQVDSPRGSRTTAGVWNVPFSLLRPEGVSEETPKYRVGQAIKVPAYNYGRSREELISGVVVKAVGGFYEVLLATGRTKLAPYADAQPCPPRSEEEIMGSIRQMYSSLSPENLSCDGELTATQTARRARKYRRCLRALETELGRRVGEMEAYGYRS